MVILTSPIKDLPYTCINRIISIFVLENYAVSNHRAKNTKSAILRYNVNPLLSDKVDSSWH